MTIDAYTNPDFGTAEKLIFFFTAFFGVLLCVFVILGGARIASLASSSRSSRYNRLHNRVQRFYEMIISATSVMSFSCAYVILNHIYMLLMERQGSVDQGSWSAFINAWENGKDFILLILICLSCVLNSILDRLLIPLKMLKKEEKACVRMLAMFYVIIILMYLNVVGDESEYNPVMMYYLGLMIGRFVYFDASFADFIQSLKNMLKNIYLLIFGLLLTGLLCYFGFSKGYLLERNYYLVGVFYTHLFMLLAVFILHNSRILKLIVRKPRDYREDDDDEEDDGYEEYDDEGYDGYAEYEEDGYGGYPAYEEDGYDGYEGYDEGYENYDGV
ncbi:MAG: hypothetical protein K6F34_03650 [Lachnospiraceae bacterium]|nr:hypothetical protein [Lachnospiraceae bacterium]